MVGNGIGDPFSTWTELIYFSLLANTLRQGITVKVLRLQWVDSIIDWDFYPWFRNNSRRMKTLILNQLYATYKLTLFYILFREKMFFKLSKFLRRSLLIFIIKGFRALFKYIGIIFKHIDSTYTEDLDRSKRTRE